MLYARHASGRQILRLKHYNIIEAPVSYDAPDPAFTSAMHMTTHKTDSGSAAMQHQLASKVM